jgi:hypothetical protein
MAQLVAASMARQTGFFHETRNPTAQYVWIEGASVASQKKVRDLAISTEKWTRSSEVGADPGNRTLSHRDDSILFPFSKMDMESASVCIEILELQIAEFGTTEPVGIEELKNRTITDSEGISDIRDREQAPDLPNGHSNARQAFLRTGKDQIACWIIGNDALSIHPPEPIP